MTQDLGGRQTNKVMTERVSISRKNNNLRISIKSNAFILGNNALSLLFVTGLLGELILGVLISYTPINMAAAFTGILCLGLITVVFIVKFWMWHQFGEEVINIQDNRLNTVRNYGFFSGKSIDLNLISNTELFVNRIDSWSWLSMRYNGILRIVSDQNMIDFGVKLNDADYAMVLKPIADHIILLQKSQHNRTEEKNEKSVSNDINGKTRLPETNGKTRLPEANGKIRLPKTNGKEISDYWETQK